MVSDIISCLKENERDSVELSLLKRAEQLVDQGDIESADAVLDNKEKISRIAVCGEED